MENKPTFDWWGAPRDFDARKKERKISWLELFYDLVYVAAISQLTHQMANHLSWSHIGFSFLLFSMIFWSWVNGSQYYDLHGSDSIRTRIFTFFQMLAIAAIAITLHDGYEGKHQALAISFIVIQCLITYLWWSVGYWDHSHRILNRSYTIHYLFALAILVVSIFMPIRTATTLWAVVLLLNLTPGLTGARTIVSVLRSRGQVFSASDAIVERFGLFTIIVLAESILATISRVAEIKEKIPAYWIAYILGILISFLLWSIYFDMTSEKETRTGYKYMQWLIFLHFPLLFGLNVLGACFTRLLSESDHTDLSSTYWVFCISLSIILLMTAFLSHAMKEYPEDRSYITPVSKLLFIISGLLLVLPFLVQHMGVIPFLAIIACLSFIPVFIGIRSWVKYRQGINL